MTTDLRRADQISDDAIKRQATVTIGDTTGRLDSVIHIGDRISLVLVVDGTRQWLHMNADTVVEIHRQENPS